MWLCLGNKNLIDFKEIRNLIQKGEYKKVLEFVIKSNNDSLSTYQKLKLKLLESEIKTIQGSPKEGLIISEKIIKESKELPNNYLLIDSYICKIENEMQLGNYENILILITETYNLLAKRKKSEIEYKRRNAILSTKRGKYFYAKGMFDEALLNYKDSLKIFVSLKDKYNECFMLSSIGLVNRIKGNYKSSEKYIIRSLEISEKNGYKLLTGISNTALGSLYTNKGEHDKALNYLFESLKIFKKLGANGSIASVTNNIGTIYDLTGDFDQALSHYNEALVFFKKLENEQKIAVVKYNIARIYQYKGQFEEALNLMKDCLLIFQKRGDIQVIAACFNGIGKIYQQIGDFQQALHYFQLGYQIRDAVSNKISTSRTIYHLISVCLDLEKITQAKQYSEELSNISKDTDNEVVKQRALIAQALILKKSPRLKEHVKAEEILSKIVKGKMIDQESFVDALLNLCELLTLEIKQTNNLDLLKEVNEHVNKFHQIATNQKSKLLLAESNWLQAQIALIELDMNKARNLLNQAEINAQELGFSRLLFRISQQQDKLLNQMSEFENLISKNANVIERMNKLEIEKFFFKIFSERKFDIPDVPEEEPIMLLFIKKNGLPIFSRNFKPTAEDLDDSLISGFLTAVNAFVKEAFQGEGSVERIKHKKYTIILQSINSFLVSYVFIGQSYTAIKRLIQFLELIKNNEMLTNEINLLIENTVPLDTLYMTQLNTIIDKVFPLIG